MSASPASGALLTGGSSSRMGAQKHGLYLGDSTLAERAAATLEAVTATRVQVGGAPIPDLAWRHQPDLRLDAGPAAGIEAALSAGKGPVVVLAVDLPFVTTDLLQAALGMVARGATIAAPRHLGLWHPLCAAYAAAALAPLQRRLDDGDLKMQRFLDEFATPLEGDALLEFGDPDRLLMNVNTPADLARARTLLEHQHDRQPGPPNGS